MMSIMKNKSGKGGMCSNSYPMLVLKNEITIKLYTLLISRGAILNIKFMTSFAENNLSYWGDISLRWIHVFSSGAFGILW